ncbi:MAG: T9SS type B sorting domain-containing protein [Bacteroidota bacterium]
MFVINFISQAQTKGNFSSNAQSIQSQNYFTQSGDIFGTRVFVENKGQFNGRIPGNEKIYYALDNGLEQIYFTKRGLVYKQVKMPVLNEEYREAIERGELKETEPEVHYTAMNWIGSNTEGIEIEASEKQKHYITYGSKELNSSTYKQLLYKNVYPNIDIDYVIPEDHGYGVKYSLILHPGALLKDIKFLYSGDVKKIKLNKFGEVEIKTSLDDITEHAPKTFDQSTHEMASSFVLNDDTLGFSISNYNNTETFIIDPWVGSVNTLSTNNAAYDVDYDFGGNTFIYGGSNSFKVAMYNAIGSLQWTFSGTVTSIGWTAGGYASNLGVDKFLSKTFVGQGFFTGGAKVVRLDANGNYDSFVSTANTSYNEIWEMGFHCITGNVFILGGGTSSNICAATISSVTSNLTLSAFNQTATSCCQDIVSHAIDDQGNIFTYFVSAGGTPSMNNKIVRVATSFTNNVWVQTSGYNSFSEAANKGNYSGAAVSSNGFNCLSVNANYLYFYDGFNLAAYNKTTGIMVGSTTVPGLTLRQQGGIAVDDCNNIYIGGNGSIRTYTFNGTSFSTLTPIALNVTVTNQYVWDIKMNRNTKTLFVCGSGFVGTYSAGISATCAVPLGLCVFNQAGVAVSSSSITCATLGSATVSANGGTGPFSYTWIPSGQTSSVGTNLSPGTYTILVYDNGSNSNYTTTTTFISPVPLTATVGNTFILPCNGSSSGTAAIVNMAGGSGNQSYAWTTGTLTQTTNSIGGLSAGIYTVNVTDALTSCVFTGTFNILQPSSVGVMLFVSNPTVCVGQSSTLTAMGTGGSPGYIFSWTGGPTTDTFVVSSNSAGTYSYNIFVQDSHSCPANAVATVTYVANPVISVANFSICPLQTGTLNATGATNYTWNASWVGVSYTDAPTGTQQYTVVGEAQTCTSSATGSIILKSVPIPTIVTNSPVCSGQNLTFTVLGGSTFAWLGPQSYSSLLQSNTISAASPFHNGVYNVTVTAANTCTASAAITLSVHATPSLSAVGGTVCSTQTLNLNANSVPGSMYLWLGPLGYNNIFQNPSIIHPAASASGNYTVKATSPLGCTNTAIVDVTVTNMQSIYPTNNSPLCFGDNLTFNPNNTGGLNFAWNGPAGFNSLLQNPSINNVSLTANGIYSITVSAGPCIKTGTTMVLVHALPSPLAFNDGPVCELRPFHLSVSTPSNNTITAYVWQGPGNFVAYSAQSQVTTSQLIHSGIYSILVTDNHGCKNSSTTTVSILNNPTVTASGDTVCLYQPAELKAFGANSFRWYNNTGNFSSLPNASITKASNVAPTVYTVIGTSANTCTASATATLYTWALPQPSVSVWPNNAACIFNTFNLEGQGALYYSWTGPGNRQYSGQNLHLFVNSMTYSGVYTLTGIDQHNCRTDVTTQITVYNLPDGYLSKGIREACIPFTSEYVFSPASGNASLTSFSWDLDGKTNTTGSFFKTFTKPGTYLLKARMTDVNGCANTMTVMINAWPQPIANFSYSPSAPIENSDEVIFNSTSTGIQLTEWNWFFAPEINQKTGYTVNKEVTSYLFREAGNYPVALVVKNLNGCSDSVVKVIHIEEDFNVYVPTAFTPNADKENDLFMPVTRGIKAYHFYVFDRWDEKMFESTDPAAGWNGTHKGKECKQDVYVWKLIVTSKHDVQKVYTGEVTLIK